MTDAAISPDLELEERRRVLAALRALWPHSIGACRPLALGIAHAIAAELPDLPRERLRAVISYHCRSTRYLRACSAEGAMRVDLRGAEVEPVSAEHRAQAAARVVHIRKTMKKGKAA
jgi:sRNA-binding protein